MPGVAEVTVLTLPFLYLVICRPFSLGADFFSAFGLAVRLAGMLLPAADTYVPSVKVQVRLGSAVSSTFRVVARLSTAIIWSRSRSNISGSVIWLDNIT